MNRQTAATWTKLDATSDGDDVADRWRVALAGEGRSLLIDDEPLHRLYRRQEVVGDSPATFATGG